MKLHLQTLLGLCGAVILIAMFATPSTARAQQAAGSITGLVTDASGSAVANATVTARDVERGTTWVTTTTDSGLYEFPVIPVGKIEVKIAAAGFAVEVRSPFTLVLNQVAKVDFRLSLGNVNTTVTVNDVPPLLHIPEQPSGSGRSICDAYVISSKRDSRP